MSYLQENFVIARLKKFIFFIPFSFFMISRASFFSVLFFSLLFFSACGNENSGNDVFQRDASKPILFEEFSDFECPYCKEFHPIVEKLRTDFPNVQFRYAYFPLENLHKYAFPAAESAECVRKNESSEVFQKYVSAVYASSNLQPETLKSLAQESGANTEKLSTCISTKESQARIKNDLKEGTQRGVTGTPTVFINGKKYDGERSYEKLYLELKNIK